MTEKKERLLYGHVDDEILSHEDPEQYAYDKFSQMDPEDADGRILTVHEFAPKVVKREWLCHVADGLIEYLEEQYWYEEFTGPDGEGNIVSDRGELVELLQKWVDRTTVWQCDPTGKVFRYRQDEANDWVIEVQDDG